jgi:hypothetical protein
LTGTRRGGIEYHIIQEKDFPTKPILSRERRGKRRVLIEDGRAAEGTTFGMPGFFIEAP